MSRSFLILGIGSFVPFFLTKLGPDRVKVLSGIGYLLVCAIGGLAWLTLFVYFYRCAPQEQRSKLAVLLPLLIFAFSFPADLIFLGLSWGTGGSNDDMP